LTRQFNQQIHCPNCQTWITHETSFGRWIRNNKELDSKQGYCVIDQDYWIHRFKTFRGKDYQLIMMVEIKTLGSDLTDAQRDTLHIVNQITRNRRQTPTKNLKFQSDDCYVSKVFSYVSQKRISLRAYGAHVLRFSGLGPDDSEWIMWDKQPISTTLLTDILKFDLDPDDISKPLDLRYHHSYRINKQATLFSQQNEVCLCHSPTA
jgi:hypothetical protein